MNVPAATRAAYQVAHTISGVFHGDKPLPVVYRKILHVDAIRCTLRHSPRLNRRFGLQNAKQRTGRN